MRSLSEFRKSKGFSQEEMGKKLGLSQATYQSYESGRTSIPEEIKAKIKRLGYDGPWPVREAKEAAAPGITPESFHREIGKLEGRLERLERAFEALGEIVRELALRDKERTLKGGG